MDLVTYVTLNDNEERTYQNHPIGGIAAKSRVKDLDARSDFREIVQRTKAWLDSGKAEPEEQTDIPQMDESEPIEF